ncbi:MAG TPA: hypothetical protein VLG14_10935 [Sphingomonas sp.]|nr:hypothetical protein [Sphingomonas sp.]
MPRDRDNISASLTKKGFAESGGDHYFFVYVNLAGLKTMKKTKMSRGSSHKVIGDNLLGRMAKQLGLGKGDFLKLVDCPLDQAGYEAIAFPSK